jgi:hypothetical protein
MTNFMPFYTTLPIESGKLQHRPESDKGKKGGPNRREDKTWVWVKPMDEIDLIDEIIKNS